MSLKTAALESHRSRSIGRRLTVRDCVPAAFSTWARNAPAFALVSAVYQLPMILFLRFVPMKSASDWGSIGLGIASMLLPFLSWNLTLGAVTYGVLEARRGRRAPTRRCLGIAFRTMPTLFGISFRMAVDLLLWGGLAGFIATILAGILPFTRATAGSMSWGSMGFILAVVGVAFLAYFSRYATSGPIAVVERLDYWYSMDRSRLLTRGRRWAAATTMFLVAAPPIALSMGLSFFAHDSDGGMLTSDAWTWIGTGVDVLAGGPLAGAAVATIYHALRRERDGVDADELVRVFE